MDQVRTIDVAGFTYRGDVLCVGDAAMVAMDRVEDLTGAVDESEDVHSLIAEWARREFPELGIWVPGESWVYNTAVREWGDKLPKPFTIDQVSDGEECSVCAARIER